MRECPFCHCQNPDDARFCTECGKAIPQSKKCPSCGYILSESDKFCPECGRKVDDVDNNGTEQMFNVDSESFEDGGSSYSMSKIVTTVVVIVFVVAGCFFSLQRCQTSSNHDMIDTIDTATVAEIDTTYVGEETDDDIQLENNQDENLSKLHPYIGNWSRSLRTESGGLGTMDLCIRKDGSGTMSIIDRGIDGLSREVIAKIDFDDAMVYDDELWLCASGKTMAETPKLKIRDGIIYDYNGAGAFEKATEEP